jgi:hypothetical protein
MKTRLMRAVLATAGVLLLSSEAGSSGPAECAELSVRIEGLPQPLSMECGTRGIGGGGDQGSGTSEFIQAIGVDFVFVVTHAAAGHHTYFLRLGVKDVVENYRAFDTTDGWGDETESGEFAVRRFEAGLAGSGARAACFGFTRFSGHVARTTGYRHHLSGFYCDLAGSPPTDGRIDEMMNSVKYDF